MRCSLLLDTGEDAPSASLRDPVRANASADAPAADKSSAKVQAKPRKLTWKETQELKALEARLEALGAEKEALEAQLSGGELSGEALQAASVRYGTLQEELDAAEMRWLELSV